MSRKIVMFAVYLTTHGVRNVLLKDGAWTDPSNCKPDPELNGMQLHRPRLFGLKYQAIAFARARGSATDDRISVARWEGL